jgi:serine/threonine-protein kinase RsbW
MTHDDPHNESTFHVCVIKSEQSETEIPKKAIFEQLARCQFSDEIQFGIKLALEEALTNAVKHGNAEDPTKSVTVRFAISRKKAVFIIRDEGRGFVPDQVPDPTTPDRLDNPSGRGLMLIRTYMDKVQFRDEGREIYFEKCRQ